MYIRLLGLLKDITGLRPLGFDVTLHIVFCWVALNLHIFSINGLVCLGIVRSSDWDAGKLISPHDTVVSVSIHESRVCSVVA